MADKGLHQDVRRLWFSKIMDMLIEVLVLEEAGHPLVIQGLPKPPYLLRFYRTWIHSIQWEIFARLLDNYQHLCSFSACLLPSYKRLLVNLLEGLGQLISRYIKSFESFELEKCTKCHLDPSVLLWFWKWGPKRGIWIWKLWSKRWFYAWAWSWSWSNFQWQKLPFISRLLMNISQESRFTLHITQAF